MKKILLVLTLTVVVSAGAFARVHHGGSTHTHTNICGHIRSY